VRAESMPAGQKEPHYNKSMQNNITVWFNQYGTDEKYAEVCGVWGEEIFKDLQSNVDFLYGVKYEDFEVEEEGEGWVMYDYDGIGIFVVKEGYDKEKCKAEYDFMGD
jgi:hypothetical protein